MMDEIDESYLIDYFSWTVTDFSTLCTTSLNNIFQKTSSPTSTLIHLCCTQIIRQAKLLEINHVYFPSNLYQVLMFEAIRQDLPETAAFLMSTWPTKIFSVINVVPYPEDICEGVTRGYGPYLLEACPGFIDENQNNAFKIILSIVRLFLDILKKGLTPNLRVLNLCGWILSDPTMNVITREVVNFSNEVRLSDDYHIIIECDIGDTYDELISFLENHHKSQDAKIHLHFKKLDISRLSEDQISQLLQQINPTDVIGLCMSNFSSDFMALTFSKVSSLIALVVTEIHFPSRKQMLPLHLLPHLSRLGLTTYGCGLSVCIPKSILSQLEYLNIYDCVENSVIENDFRYMLSVPLHFRELNLSRRRVDDGHLHLWRDLFLSLAPTLMILILENCIRDDNHFASIVSFILPLANLVFLDLVCNEIGMDSLYENLPKLGLMPRLKKIALRTPTNHHGDSFLIDGEGVIKFQCKVIDQIMATRKISPTKIDWY